MFGFKNKNNQGQQAERLAKQYLKQQGLCWQQSNYHCRQGEIDLIFMDAQQLVFVEVRYRKSNRYGGAAETVDQRKQNKLILAARHYLHTHNLTEAISCRFDIISIENSTTASSNTIQWLKNAFYSE